MTFTPHSHRTSLTTPVISKTLETLLSGQRFAEGCYLLVRFIDLALGDPDLINTSELSDWYHDSASNTLKVIKQLQNGDYGEFIELPHIFELAHKYSLYVQTPHDHIRALLNIKLTTDQWMTIDLLLTMTLDNANLQQYPARMQAIAMLKLLDLIESYDDSISLRHCHKQLVKAATQLWYFCECHDVDHSLLPSTVRDTIQALAKQNSEYLDLSHIKEFQCVRSPSDGLEQDLSIVLHPDDIVIGTGSYATVYRVIRDSGTYVVKSFYECGEGLNEYIIGRMLNSNYILHPLSYKITADEEVGYIVDLVYPCALQDLGQYLKELCDAEATIDNQLAFAYLRQVALGLQVMHRAGVAHRDLKAQNLLLYPDNKIQIADLGSARIVHGSDNASKISWLYAPPERFINADPDIPDFKLSLNTYIDDAFAADMWSLGCIVYEMYNSEKLVPTSVLRNGSTLRNTVGVYVTTLTIESIITSCPQSTPEIIKILLRGLLHPNPEQRLTTTDLLDILDS